MRKPRKTQKGATYHVVARANRKEFIFRRDFIKDLFLETIHDAHDRYSFRVMNICIMSNHVHLMIKPDNGENISRVMQWILGVFAMRFNRELGLQGHVWYDRFKSKVIESFRQFLATFLYISENPLRAGLVESVDEYKYVGNRIIRDGPTDVMNDVPGVLRLLVPCFGPLSLSPPKAE
ncbi:MAG: transposase [Spirochaetaceae bacterium]|nr:MAG: transposase [Spirochaetaceae bacterium]